MELSILGFENKIIFDRMHINVLEIADKKLFTKILFLLNNEFNGIKNGNEIVLRKNNNVVDINKNIYIVFDIFNIDFNSKSILNKLYKLIKNNIKLSEDYQLEEIVFKFRNYLINEINELPFEFSMNSDIEIEDVLKLFSVKIDESYYLSLIEKIEFLIDIISTLKIAKILVIPNLKLFLVGDELIELYKYAKYKNLNLLLIENNIAERILEYEKKYIIDAEFDDFIKILWYNNR